MSTWPRRLSTWSGTPGIGPGARHDVHLSSDACRRPRGGRGAGPGVPLVAPWRSTRGAPDRSVGAPVVVAPPWSAAAVPGGARAAVDGAGPSDRDGAGAAGRGHGR